MFLKRILLVSAAVAMCSADVAAAQRSSDNAPAAPTAAAPPITPTLHNALTLGGTSSSGGRKGKAGSITTQAVAGWNYVHATSCTYLNNGYIYVYPSEGGYWYSNVQEFKDALLTQCSTGNWVALYVTDPNAGTFSQVYTYDYR
jgi:hypothetical protein